MRVAKVLNEIPYTYVGNDPTDKTDPTGMLVGDDTVSDQLASSELEFAQQNPSAALAIGIGGMAVGSVPAALAIAPELAAAVSAKMEQRALQSMFRNGPPKASDLAKFAEKRGWTRTQTENGPIKFVDENGTPRMILKEGSPRTPGSKDPHVELRDSSGRRINPQGQPVSRRSPENHSPIRNDMKQDKPKVNCTGSRIAVDQADSGPTCTSF